MMKNDIIEFALAWKRNLIDNGFISSMKNISRGHDNLSRRGKSSCNVNDDMMIGELVTKGNLCFRNGVHEKALSHYLQAMRIITPDITKEKSLLSNISFPHTTNFDSVKEAKQVFHATKILLNIGAVLTKTGNMNKAMEFLDASLQLSLSLINKFGSPHLMQSGKNRIFRNADDDVIKIQCMEITSDILRNKSVIYLRRIDYTSAYETLKECLAYKRSVLAMVQANRTSDILVRSCRHSLAQILEAYGRTCSLRGLFDESKLAYCEAVNLSFDREQKETTQLLTALGDLYTACDEFQDAYSSYIFLSEILKRDKDINGLIDVSLKLSRMYQKQKDYDAALQQAQQAFVCAADVDCISKFQKTILLSSAMSQLGSLYESVEKFVKAKKWYKKALDERLNGLVLEHPLVVESIISIANLYKIKKRCDRAISIYIKCLGKYIRAFGENHRICAILTGKLAEAHSTLGNHQKAIELHEEARKRICMALRGRTNHPEVAILLKNMAISYCNAGRMEDSMDLFSEALCILEKCGVTSNHPTVTETLEAIDNYFVTSNQSSTVTNTKSF